jgi:hypothetical protein
MAATDPTFEAEPELEPATTEPHPEPHPEPVARSETVEAPSDGHAAGGCPVTWCPICVTVGAVQPLRPDVVEHLLKAGTELFMAFRAVIDARADEASGSHEEGPPPATTLEKIDLG